MDNDVERLAREKHAAQCKAWRQAHPERMRELHRRYKERNPGANASSCRKWRQNHPDKDRENHRKYYAEHRDELNRRARERYWAKKEAASHGND